jgi:hypothetical protein
MVVRCGAKVSVLGNDTVLPDRNRSDAIKRRVIANPTMFADHHFPRECNTNPRPDQNVATDSGSEKPQHETSPGIKGLRRGPYKERVQKPPKLNKPRGSSAGALGISEAG